MNLDIVRLITRIILPLVVAYAFYIQINGSNNPGGGFQAGAILASTFILIDLLFSYQILVESFSRKFLQMLSSFGIILYMIPGLLALLAGDNFLDYNSLEYSWMEPQKFGIIIVEWGVGVTVFSALSLIYISFTEK